MLAAPNTGVNPTIQKKAQEKFVLSKPQSPDGNAVFRVQGNIFNEFISIQQPSIQFNYIALLFPVESIDNQKKFFTHELEIESVV